MVTMHIFNASCSGFIRQPSSKSGASARPPSSWTTARSTALSLTKSKARWATSASTFRPGLNLSASQPGKSSGNTRWKLCAKLSPTPFATAIIWTPGTPKSGGMMNASCSSILEGCRRPLRVEEPKRGHRSIPRNRKIAEMFYYAGWIEQWGSGTLKILRECVAALLA